MTKQTNGIVALSATVSNVGCVGAPFTVDRSIRVGPYSTTILGPYDPSLNAIVNIACVGEEYYFYAQEPSTAFSPFTYQWTLFPPTGFPTLYSGVQPYITFDEPGTHRLQVTKSTSCGDIITEVNINVQECLEGFSAYPNPSNGILIIDPYGGDSSSNNSYNKRQPTKSKSYSPSIRKVTIYDMAGRFVKAVTIEQAGLIKIEVNNLASGFYVVEITGKNGAVKRKKIIIQH